jgi:GH35 family endo-1,4-beta-xylanase
MQTAMRRGLAICALLAPVGPCASAEAQTTIAGATMALRSTGASQGASWTLDRNGYVGQFFTLDAPGEVTIDVQASGVHSGGVSPRMNLVVADRSISFDVTAAPAIYSHTMTLPAGTHVIRAELGNDDERSARSLTIDSVALSGISTVNRSGDSTALAAANTYIENFRQGPARLELLGVSPGEPVHVELARHEFNFGTAVGGSSNNVNQSFVRPNPNPNANPGTGAYNAYRYQQFLKSHFNLIVPSNGGKWNVTEGFRDAQNMALSDAMAAFAAQNGMRFRQHNMLWGNTGGSPGWANTLLASAAAGSQAAKDELLAEIHERIAYYVGDGVGADRATNYIELDVLNEGVHVGQYLSAFGPEGLAEIFNAVGAAVDAAGASTKLYVNEYNVLQNSSDAYANWFREHGETIAAAGGRVDGYGVQYYSSLAAGQSSPHSPLRILQVFQNLSNDGKTFLLSEFGVSASGQPTPANVANALEDTMRMVFGSDGAIGFNIWGFWANDVWNQAPLAALVDSSWNLTPVGVRYEALMNQWDTNLNLVVGPDGAVDFRGFYGDYKVTVGGRTFDMALRKGVDEYQIVVVPEPAGCGLALVALLGLVCKRPIESRNSVARTASGS